MFFVIWNNSGLLPSLVGVSHVAIQFPMYENTKSYIARRGNSSLPNESSSLIIHIIVSYGWNKLQKAQLWISLVLGR